MAITKNKRAARCLGLTRLISRVGRGPWTGIDRVELEYLARLRQADAPIYALVRLRRSYAVFDPDGVRAIEKFLLAHAGRGKHNSRPKFTEKSIVIRLKTHAMARRAAIARAQEGGLKNLLERTLPPGTAYLNVGHSNLSAEVLSGFRALRDAHISVFVHDTIPLDFPQFQRDTSVSGFDAKLRNVAKFADLIICNSRQTKQDVTRVMADWGKIPPIIVAHLGVKTATAAPKELPRGTDLSRPYFVTVGTIEPRKNHALLLDIWERFSVKPDAPRLFIVGRRGWNNETVFQRLDRRPANVVELNNLSDGATTALVQGYCGLLAPSHCEGFGLPVVEAAALGVPVICNKLAVFREILSEYPIYADVADIYSWETMIRKLAVNSGSVNSLMQGTGVELAIPDWTDHFDQVLRLT
jgi:glycosyltransferase involved in cell wall biosynthesis